MNREETLAFCTKCEHQKFERNQGIICSLTDQKGAFLGTCEDFKWDETTPVEQVERFTPVSWGRRLLTYFLDIIVYYFTAVILGIIIYFFNASSLFESINENILGIIIIFIYYFTFEALLGRTPGKMITGTIAVMENGNRLTGKAAAIRTLCRFIPFEQFPFMKSNPIGIHDSMSHTKVVRYDKTIGMKDMDILDVDFE